MGPLSTSARFPLRRSFIFGTALQFFVVWPYTAGYLSQIDGLWRFAAPHSFHLALLALEEADVRPPNEGTIDMPIGTVKFFNDSKGYGFIQPDGGGNDAFVHVTDVERAGMRSLVQNQRLSYDLEQNQRGKTSAVNLKAAEASADSEPATDA